MSCIKLYIKLLIGLLGPVLLTLALALDQDALPLETATSGPSVHAPINDIEQIEVSGYSLPEVLQRGEQIYWRSCVNCHGILPPQFRSASQPQHFVETVRGGSGAMPGLGYKINAVEAEMVRWYLSECTRHLRMC
jgi:mono/diheme cytochrome c family protein